MSKELRRLLSAGDLRTTGHSDKVVRMVSRLAALLPELVRLLEDEDSGVRMRAFDALEKITEETPHAVPKSLIEKVFSSGLHSEQQEVLWHWCQIVPRLPLTSSDAERAFKRMNALRGAKSRIVWTFALQGMFDLAQKHPILLKKAKVALTQDCESGVPSVKARCRKLLKRIDE